MKTNFLLYKFNIYIFFFTSLLISYSLGENSSGGSYLDYKSTQKFIEAFDQNLFDGFRWFITNDQIHFPFFYILKYYLIKFFSQTIVHIIYIFLSSLIPYFLFKSIYLKFPECDKKIILLFSCVVFLSPHFRSSAVWITSDNLGSLFFILSIYNFIIFSNNKENHFANVYYSILFLVLATYIRQNYIFFSIIFLFYFFEKLSFINLLKVLIFLIIILIPSFIYLYFFFFTEKQTLTLAATINFNFLYNYLVFSALFFFYFFPLFFYFFLNKKKSKEIIFNNLNKFWLLLVFYSLLLIFYQIPDVQYGGGIFYKISALIDIRIFFIFSFLGSISLILFNKFNINNIIIYSILIFSFPFIFVYQKYYDPLFYLTFFTLVDNNFNETLFKKNNFVMKFFLIYNFAFLIGSIYYYN
jgi:hypothetical protein